MLTFTFSMLLGIGLGWLCTRQTEKTQELPNSALSDLQQAIAKDRASAKPDHRLMKYYWYDLPENLEIVNRLLARGYWRNVLGQMTNGKKIVWLEHTEAMGWTAYVQGSRGKQPCWKPEKFPEHLEALLKTP